MREAVHINTTCKTCQHSQCPERTRWYPCKDCERKETSTTGTAYNLPERGGDSAKITGVQFHRN